MTSEQLDTIIDEAPGKLGVILGELHGRILEAASAALEASQDTDDGGKPKVAVALKVAIDLNQSPPAWHVEGAVGVRYKACSEIEQVEETPELEPGFGKGRAAKKLDKAIRDLRVGGVTISRGGAA